MSMSDETFSTTTNGGGTKASVKAAANDVLKDATAQAKAAAEQAAVKAKEIYGGARTVATQRAEQAREMVVERPYAAVGLALLVGVLVGQALTARRPQVVYLKERRPI